MSKAKPRFKPYNYDQNAMVVINYRDQLQSGTFEHAVHYLIEHKLDLSVFRIKQITGTDLFLGLSNLLK